jgi:putative oxidoreductase
MFIAHSVVLKYFNFTLAGTAGYFESLDLPGFLAYVVFGMEAVGGALLVLGVRTREVAAALIPVLVGALWVHAGNGWVFSNAGGGWEYPLYLVVLSAAQVLLGEGAFALSRSSVPSRHSAARLTA